MTRSILSAVWVLCLLAASSCGGPKECLLTDASSCPESQACEAVAGRDKPLCLPPVVVTGKVFDLATAAGISGAEVMATDENGAPAGTSVKSGSDGIYRLRVPTARTDEKGAFAGRGVLLRAQAKDYVAFPSGTRVSLPINTQGATQKDEASPFELKTALTDIGLSGVPAGQTGRPTVSGVVDLPPGNKAVLLVLESGASAGRATLSAGDGHFTFFNVEPGGYTVSAYTQGSNYTPASVSVTAGTDLSNVALKRAGDATASMSGSVQLVAGANGDGTSVVLVVESTYIESLGRGEVPPGLRAPNPGTAPTITGSFTVTGIPDGKYVVLAAFENDGNVRDPDPNISGTQVQRITVAGANVPGTPSFKVTGAVPLISPGASSAEDTTATPTFTWGAYSNADGWKLTVFDTLGVKVWDVDIADKGTTSMAYGGAALTAGQYYQWRVTALRRGDATSHTEELRGVFRVAP